MNMNIIRISSSLFIFNFIFTYIQVLVVHVQGQQPQNGLGFKESVKQAKTQMKYFLARNVPVKASLNTLEEYYIDHEERELPLQPRYSGISRKPCKVLPDPDPGLVNPRLVEPIHKYKPLYKNEKFYGKFAPPIKLEMMNTDPPPILPPMSKVYVNQNENQNWNENNNQNRNENRNQNQYQNPFYGYQGGYDARNEYFQKDTDTIRPKIKVKHTLNFDPYPYTILTTTATEASSTFSINPTSWISNLSIDYSVKLASMSSALKSNSAALASISFSVKMASMSSVFAQKEASLRSRISQYSATGTATATHRRGWHW